MKRPDAAAALRELRDSPDPEIARRAARIIEEISRRRFARRRQRLELLAKHGAVDQVADFLGRWAD